MKIKPLERRNGKLTTTGNMLFTFDVIQEACIKLGFDNEKMFDEKRQNLMIFHEILVKNAKNRTCSCPW